MSYYTVTIPNWSEGLPLSIHGISADSSQKAIERAIKWVNQYAGYDYCTALPKGTQVVHELDTAGLIESDE